MAHPKTPRPAKKPTDKPPRRFPLIRPRFTPPPPEAGSRPPRNPGLTWSRHPGPIAGAALVVGVAGTFAFASLGILPIADTNSGSAVPTALVTVTAIATATVTEPIDPTPSDSATSEPSASATGTPTVGGPPPGTLAIIISMTSGGKIGPNEYRAGATPTAFAAVIDESGRQLSRGCYPTWVLRRGTTVVQSVRGESCGSGIDITRDSLKVRGLYHLTISVTTDAGPKATKTLDFQAT